MLLEPGVCRKYSQHARSPASVQLVLPACSKSCEHAEVQPACTKSSQHAQSPANMHRVQPACTESSQHAESPASMNGAQEARFRSGLLTARVSGSGFRIRCLCAAKVAVLAQDATFHGIPPRPVSGHPTDRRSSFPAGHGPSTKLVGLPPEKRAASVRYSDKEDQT